MTLKDRLNRFQNIIAYIVDSYRNKCNKAVVSLGADDKASNIYRYFNKRSKKFLGLKRLTIAVALINLRRYNSFEEYRLTIRGKNSADYFKRRCEKKGYTFKKIDRNNFIDEIHEINTSLEMRCGKIMESSYRKRIVSYNADDSLSYGVFIDNKLIAYINLSCYNELIKINRILGHGDFLGDNIMYFLVFKTIEEIYSNSSITAQYLMYDSFWGNPKGLVLFKNRFKFEAYKVKWILE